MCSGDRSLPSSRQVPGCACRCPYACIACCHKCPSRAHGVDFAQLIARSNLRPGLLQGGDRSDRRQPELTQALVMQVREAQRRTELAAEQASAWLNVHATVYKICFASALSCKYWQPANIARHLLQAHTLLKARPSWDRMMSEASH